MANQFAVAPYTLTATMGATLKNTSGAAFSNGSMFIYKIRWTTPPASGSFILQDAHSNVIAQMVTTAGGEDVENNFDPPLPFQDFKATTFTSGGIVTIYCLM